MSIDWSQLITKAMKDVALQAALLATAKTDLSARNLTAVNQIARIRDRVDTLGYGVESGEATEEDLAELAALPLILKAWTDYKFRLGKVATQATWPSAPVWPPTPAIPDIPADPSASFDAA